MSFEASDPEWFKDNPHAIIFVDIKDKSDKNKVMKGVTTAISKYKDETINWNYTEAISLAYDWLKSEGYSISYPYAYDRIDLG